MQYNFKKYISLLLLSVLFVIPAKAQHKSKIDGYIVNEKNEPLSGAIITQISIPDSTIISYAMADKEGVFSIDIEGDTNHSTILEFSFLGYEKLYLSPSNTQTYDGQYIINGNASFVTC